MPVVVVLAVVVLAVVVLAAPSPLPSGAASPLGDTLAAAPPRSGGHTLRGSCSQS